MALLMPPALADSPMSATEWQAHINLKYQHYFGSNSQALLPFGTIERSDWKQLQASKPLKRVYSEPDKFYNSKVYTFTLYQSVEDNVYYLDAKGGFWGMDELIYGPISEKELQ